jgi:E3 ubiquitin-protein ligase SHPRH
LASFKSAQDADGRRFYVSHLQGQILTHFNFAWNPQRDLKGGILAEEMGLGKTVELLALICHHKVVPSPEKVKDPYTGHFVTPSHSTLIITPPSILEQWKSEIATHAPHLKVFHYQGLPSASAPQDAHDAATPENLLQYDIVLTTYHVLSREIHYAKPPPDRSLRHEKHYEPRKSPLVQICWWRVCLDEAQMVESGVSQQATVARLIPRVNAWAVSGTPLRKDIQDLRGLLVFLRYEPYSTCKPIWDRLDKATFKDIFGQIAMRHTKDKIRNELTLPPQKRMVIRVPFTAIEEQNYSEMIRQMCEDCGLSPEGLPLGENVDASPFPVDKMRDWLVRLRQTCLHLHVGRRNRKALNARNGPPPTIDKVLDAMIDNADASLKAEARELVRGHLLCGHIRGNAGDDERRDEAALVEYRKALEHVLLWVTRCRDELAKAKENASETSADAKDNKKDANDDESDADDDDDDNSGRISNIKKTLRTFLEIEHQCRIFIADSYFRLKANENLTEPESENFDRLANLETEYYEQAKKIRSVLLKATKRKAQEQKSKVDSQRDLAAPRINYISDQGGIETGKVLESMENVCDLLDRQATLLEHWRKKVVDMALAPLVDEDEGMETTGDEYEMSIKIQEQLLVYTLALRTAIADRNFVLNGLQDPLVNQEFQAAEAQAHRGEGHAPDLVIQFAKARKEIGLEHAGISLKGVISAIRSLITELQWRADGRDQRAKLELSIAENTLAAVQKIAASQKVSLANFDKEQELFRTAMNRRVEYYRQLQQLSDGVTRWREELDPTLCRAAFEQSDKDRNKSQKRMEALEIKVKYLVNMRHTDHGDAEEDCAICIKPMTEAAMTPCGHVFDKECVEKWIASAGRCPVCRRTVRKSELIIHAPKRKITELQEEVMINGSPAQASTPSADSTSIYGNISSATMAQINDIDLGGISYGSKIDMIARHLLWIRHNDPGSKTVIFSQFGDFLDVLKEALKKWKIGCASMSSRHGVQDFKSNPATEAFLLDAKTDASGLNLVNATYVFLAEPMVNVALELQAIARVHRIGQRRPTTVFMYLVSDTVEEAIYDLSVSRRLEHIGRSRASESDSVSPALQESALETANSLELQAAPIKQLLRKKGDGEVVPSDDLWKCLFGKRQRVALMQEVGRELRAAAVEERVAGLALE